MTALQDGTSIDGVSITFAKADGSNDPGLSYSPVRMYGGNTLTISVADNKVITKIVITFCSKTGALTCDVGSYSSGTWTGSSATVVFQNGANSSTGQAQISSIVVTYAD